MKAYIVEDHESMRIILKRLLRKNFPELTEIRESETAEQALEEIPAINPDLVLVDISLPGMDGIELIRRLKPQCGGALCLLVVTGHEIDVYRVSADEAGAHGIVSKSDDRKLLERVGELLRKRKTDGCC